MNSVECNLKIEQFWRTQFTATPALDKSFLDKSFFGQMEVGFIQQIFLVVLSEK